MCPSISSAEHIEQNLSFLHALQYFVLNPLFIGVPHPPWHFYNDASF